MIISLQQVIPIPLKDKLLARDSDVWNREVSLMPGDWIKIKAPSGTGKTTLVHTIWQIRKDYSGKVLYNNQPTDAIDADEIAKLRQNKMSVIFQDLRLFGHLTARENIELKRVMIKNPLYEAGMIDTMAERLGVQHILHQQASTCSYGEQQRIAIIRALMQPFEWLIMDEPFSHLDKANTQKAAALIAEECQKRKAGFLLTDLDEDEHFAYTKYLTL